MIDSSQLDAKQASRQEKLKEHAFNPQVSSFVLATNSFGDFSMCTIISQLVTSDDLKDVIAPRAEKVWRLLVHQPQTGRCLVFFEVLKVVTRKITLQYREALNTLESVLNLDVRISGLLHIAFANMIRTVSVRKSNVGRKIRMLFVSFNLDFGVSKLCTNFNAP